MKRIITIFLSFLTLVTFGQTQTTHNVGTPLTGTNGVVIQNGNIKTDSSQIPLNITIAALRASTTLQIQRLYNVIDPGRQGTFKYVSGSFTDNGGTILVDGSGNGWVRQFTGPILGSWFNLDSTGLVNNTSTFQAIANIATAHDVFINQQGVFLCDSISIPAWKHVRWYGLGKDSTEMRSVNGGQIFYVIGDQKDTKFHDIKLSSTASNTAQDFAHALYWSQGVHTDDIEFYNMRWYMPNWNATSLAILVQGNGFGGSWKYVYVHDCIFDSAGASAITLFNRDTAGSVGLVASVTTGTPSTYIRNTGLDSGKNFRIEHNEMGNLGLTSGAVNGFAITLDGCGYNGVFSYNHLFNCLNIGIENTGFWYMEVAFNQFDKVISGRSWEAWSFGNVPLRPIYFQKIHNNIEREFMSTTDAFYGVNYSTFDHNTWRTAGGLKFANSNYNKIDHDYMFGSGFNSVVLTPRYNNNVNYGTCVGNVFTNCTFDQSTSSVNVYALLLDGSATQNNTFDNCDFNITATGNFYAFSQDTCGNLNYITNPRIRGSAVTNSYHTFTLNNVRDTAKHEDDLFDWKFFRLAGNTSPGSFWLQSNVHRDFTIWNASAFVDTIWNTGTSTSTLVPAGSIVHYNGDSTNFNATTGTGTFPGALKNTGTDSVIGNLYASGTGKILGDFTTASILGDSVLLTNSTIGPGGFAEIFYKQLTAGGTSNPIGLYARIDQGAHDTTNPVVVQAYLNAAAGDSIAAGVLFRSQMNTGTGYINNVVAFQATGGTVSALQSYTAFQALNIGVVANGQVTGYYTNITKGPNRLAFQNLGTANSQFLGNVGIGSDTPDSTYGLRVQHQTWMDSALTVAAGGLKVTGSDSTIGAIYGSSTATFGGALKNTGTDSVVGNLYASGTTKLLGDLTTSSIVGDSVLLSNSTIGPGAFAEIFYKQLTVGGTSNPVGLLVRVDQGAHDTTNSVGIQSYANAAAADSMVSAILFQSQINASTGYIGTGIAFQSTGGTVNGLQKYTAFEADNIGIATGGTVQGFYSNISRGANRYLINSVSTVSSYHLGSFDIGPSTPDSVYKVHISGGMTQQDSAFEEASVQIGQGNTNPDTVTRGICALYEDPVSTLATKTIVLPAASLIGQGHRIRIFFGGALTTGVVITVLTISAQTGQSIIQNAVPTTSNAGDYIEYEYRYTSSSAGKYYRIH